MLTTFGLVKLILLLTFGPASGAGIAMMLSVDNTFLGNDRNRRILWGAIWGAVAINLLVHRLWCGMHGLSLGQEIAQDGAFLAVSYAGYRLMESYILTAFGGRDGRRF